MADETRYILMLSDGRVLGVFAKRYRAMQAQRAINQRRSELVAQSALRLVGQEYVDTSKRVTRMARHTYGTARAAAGYDVPTVSIVPVAVEPVIDPETVFPDRPVEPVEQGYEPTTAPCPKCGESIEYDDGYHEGRDYLTWCERCDWHGYVNEHLKTGNKAGAALW